MSASTLSPLIAILGPTASGKTDLAVKLARDFNGEMINADSRQVYKEIDIASAKPKFQIPNSKFLTYGGIPHHLFDVVKPDEEFNVTHFKKQAVQIIYEIHARRKLPFLAGGTGLWISAVVDNLAFPDVPPNPEFRKHQELHSPVRAIHESPLHTEQLYRQLISQDPDAAQFINPTNHRRIIRALEVIEATGRPFSAQRTKGPPLFRVLELGLTRPITELEERIEKRIQEQITQGIEREARDLFSKYDPSLPSLSSISLREWKDYFAGTHTLPETLRLIYLHNRQYAKRQMTWFKRDKRIQWIQNKEEASRLISSFLHPTSPLPLS